MIAIIDYGVGNLYSLAHSLAYIGLESCITREEKQILSADQLILPGVGAFGDAAQRLRETGMDRLILKMASTGTPLMGICLGMQLLFEKSHEYGEHQGLGLLPGEICPLRDVLPAEYKVPHIGWNELQFCRESPLTRGIREGDSVYYVHSYYAKTQEENLIAVSEYGIRVPGLVQKGNIFGAQFHPEKSGRVGLSILRAFGEVHKAC